MEKAEIKKTLTRQLREAASWAAVARRDVKREDRVDAIDAIDFSMRRLREARELISTTLPRGLVDNPTVEGA